MHHCSEYSGLVHTDHIAFWLLKDLPHVLQTVDFGSNYLNQQHNLLMFCHFFHCVVCWSRITTNHSLLHSSLINGVLISLS